MLQELCVLLAPTAHLALPSPSPALQGLSATSVGSGASRSAWIAHLGECHPGLKANRSQVPKIPGTFLYWGCAVQWKKKKKKALLLSKGFFSQFSLYCAGTNNQAPSGPCEPGYFCTGGAKNALQHVVVEGHYSLAGAFKPEPCPLGTFQPVSTSGLQPGGSAEPLETAKMCE